MDDARQGRGLLDYRKQPVGHGASALPVPLETPARGSLARGPIRALLSLPRQP